MNGHAKEEIDQVSNSASNVAANGNVANGHSTKLARTGMMDILKAKVLQTSDSYTPIKSLNTFLFDWKIKARVTKKHNKKTWKNTRG